MSDFEDLRREEKEAKKRAAVFRDEQGRPVPVGKVRLADVNFDTPARHPPLAGVVRSLVEEIDRTFSPLPGPQPAEARLQAGPAGRRRPAQGLAGGRGP
jgi:hypothetical protein